MTTPMQLSLDRLRSNGWHCEITERWNPFAKRRQDLFGFCDILAFYQDVIWAVQTTTMGHMQERIEKIKRLQSARYWLEGENRAILVHGWAKRGPRGKRKTWECKEVFL